MAQRGRLNVVCRAAPSVARPCLTALGAGGCGLGVRGREEVAAGLVSPWLADPVVPLGGLLCHSDTTQTGLEPPSEDITLMLFPVAF